MVSFSIPNGTNGTNCRIFKNCYSCVETGLPSPSPCVWTGENPFPCRNGFSDSDEVGYVSCESARADFVNLGVNTEAIKKAEDDSLGTSQVLVVASIVCFLVSFVILWTLYELYRIRQRGKRIQQQNADSGFQSSSSAMQLLARDTVAVLGSSCA